MICAVRNEKKSRKSTVVVRVESIVTNPISVSHLIDLKGFQEILIGNTRLLTGLDWAELYRRRCSY
jgi:hypothetical protein